MTPDRLRECLATVRWKQTHFAETVGRPESTVRQWLSGASRIPDDVAAWLDKLARYHDRNPPPQKFSRKEAKQ